MALQKINPHEFEWQIILNPYALSSQCIQYKEHIAFELERNQIPHRFHISERKEGTSREVASKLCQEGKTHFLIVGGDGTINEIINGIFQSGIDTRDIFVAIFPFGTGNDFCRTHLYPSDFANTLERFLNPSFVRHDVGIVKSIVNEENVGQRFFINIAGFGFDAAIAIIPIFRGKKRDFDIFRQKNIKTPKTETQKKQPQQRDATVGAVSLSKKSDGLL